MEPLPVSGPSITQREIDYVTDAVTHAWYSNHNVYHERFEHAFAEYLEVPFAIALPSCTSAIHLALSAWNVGPGDEVIVPELTWIASSAPISYVGATPVFVDVEHDTWCMSASSFEKAVTERTKAVIPVDLYGNMPALDRIESIAGVRGIAVLEDAAEAIGSQLEGKLAGSWGDAGVFSFHGSKTLTTGEGGMLVTGDEQLHRRCLFLRDHARRPGDTSFFNTEVGFKYKMSSMQAALGLAQLERVDELVSRKREIFAWYREALAGAEGLVLNSENQRTKNTFWMVTVLLPEQTNLSRDDVMDRLRQQGIATRPFFHPLSSLPAYADTPSAIGARDRNPVSYGVASRGINLPSGLNMTRDSVQRVADCLKTIVG